MLTPEQQVKGAIIENPTIHDVFDALGLAISEDTMSRKWPIFIQYNDRSISLHLDDNGAVDRILIESGIQV